MPTKRTRRTRAPRANAPAWVEPFIERGEIPERGTSAYGQFVGWYFFGEAVPGLPDYDSDAGRELMQTAGWYSS